MTEDCLDTRKVQFPRKDGTTTGQNTGATTPKRQHSVPALPNHSRPASPLPAATPASAAAGAGTAGSGGELVNGSAVLAAALQKKISRKRKVSRSAVRFIDSNCVLMFVSVASVRPKTPFRFWFLPFIFSFRTPPLVFCWPRQRLSQHPPLPPRQMPTHRNTTSFRPPMPPMCHRSPTVCRRALPAPRPPPAAHHHRRRRHNTNISFPAATTPTRTASITRHRRSRPPRPARQSRRPPRSNRWTPTTRRTFRWPPP